MTNEDDAVYDFQRTDDEWEERVEGEGGMSIHVLTPLPFVTSGSQWISFLAARFVSLE